jgi:hypothetical protein
MKKETLEEVAERYAEGKSSSSVFQEAHITDFINGAKWQAERMYSEEEVIQTIRDFKYDSIHIGDMNPEKWFKQFKNK